MTQHLLTPDAIGALRRGNKIEAIKLTRAATGLGLKEAKDCVDAWAAAHPDQIPRPTGTSAGGLMTLLALIAAVIVAGWFLLRG